MRQPKGDILCALLGALHDPVLRNMTHAVLFEALLKGPFQDLSKLGARRLWERGEGEGSRGNL